jgi:hypothetical protein
MERNTGWKDDAVTWEAVAEAVREPRVRPGCFIHAL